MRWRWPPARPRPPARSARRRSPARRRGRAARRDGLLDPDHQRQRLVVDADPLGRVLGQVTVGRDDHDDRFADVVHLPWPARTGAPWVSAGCGMSSGSGSPMRPAGPPRCRSATRPSTSSASVTSMSMIRACACGPDEGRRERVAARGRRGSGRHPQQPGVLVADERLAERAWSLMRASRSLCITPPRAAPPRRCSGSRCSGTGCRRSPRAPPPRSAGVLRAARRRLVMNPGVQKPHCRPWHSWKACCTGAGRRRAAAALDGGDLVAVGRHGEASGRSGRRPSTSTVHAPQTPCSQPTCVPVSPRSWRRKSDSSRRAGPSRAWRAVDGDCDLDAARSVTSPPPYAAFSARAVSTPCEVRTVAAVAWMSASGSELVAVGRLRPSPSLRRPVRSCTRGPGRRDKRRRRPTVNAPAS